MRLLLLCIATIFLLVASQPCGAFSSSNLPPRHQGKTSLFLTEEILERSRNQVSVADILAGISKDNDDDGTKLLDQILSTLDKRVKAGPGAISRDEVEELTAMSEQILENIQTKDKEATHLNDVVVEEEKDNDWVFPLNNNNNNGDNSPNEQQQKEDLQSAVGQLDSATVSKMARDGVFMDEETTNMAFWAAVEAIDKAESEDRPIPANVVNMIHQIFDADLRHLHQREKLTTNVTCMRPADTDVGGAARKMNYVFDDGDAVHLPLTEGRKCEGGNCCDACSRNIFPTFALDHESKIETFPELASFTFNNIEKASSATIVQFVRLIERVRRTIAHEYGLPLKSILPLQAYSRKYVAGTTQQGGGGGEGDFVTLHTDEATHDGYHYSCVLYLSTQGEDFEGGSFVFNDPSDEPDDLEALEKLPIEEQIRRAGRDLIPYHPSRGAAVIFSSGWENMHEVERITSGIRYAVPCFFTTCPVPEAAYDNMVVGKPKTDEDIAEDWLHLLLAHRTEDPMQSVGRVKELLMKWHYICTPLTEH